MCQDTLEYNDNGNLIYEKYSNKQEEKIERLELENLELKCQVSYYKRYSEFLEEKLKKIEGLK